VACPKVKHFHVICRDVRELDNFERLIEVSDPNSALEAVIKELTSDWEGSIEIRDDATLSERKFPLIDFWRTPLK
jgi:hypothetical protein